MMDAPICNRSHHDGNGIELRLNSHDAPAVVYLEPEVLEALIAWAQSLGLA